MSALLDTRIFGVFYDSTTMYGEFFIYEKGRMNRHYCPYVDGGTTPTDAGKPLDVESQFTYGRPRNDQDFDTIMKAVTGSDWYDLNNANRFLIKTFRTDDRDIVSVFYEGNLSKTITRPNVYVTIYVNGKPVN